ncbi:caspase-2-like [Homarus americanus]|uniref:Caspase-2-like 3 n=1 Tax=Homarus americanus TaxID=6706 RepID=A0A8J5K5L6_HOMAM|nr:caspase-2-like [Homarus americanus]KAG7167939.1 caspase-2-like 3 [Homarus americanus]
MDERDKEVLGQHQETIAREVVDAGRTADLIYELKTMGVIPGSVADTLQRQETTKTMKVRSLLNYLKKCEAGSFTSFLEVLLKLGLAPLVKMVDLPTYERHRGSMSGESDELDDLQRLPHIHNGQRCPPLPRPPTLDLERCPQASDNGSADNNNPELPLKIVVVPYREVGGRDLSPSEVYRNLTMPRGLVFLANYKNFHDDEHAIRIGSETDVKNLSLLFTQMGYKIPKQHMNLTKYETIQALREFKSLPELSQVDSCVVIVMSHGHDHKSFYTSDNQYLTVNDVVEVFNNKSCPALIGKPKIFIFQYCRGTGPDVGAELNPRRVVNKRGMPVFCDSANQGEVIIHRDPTYTDMCILYSTVEGFVSFRHPKLGSWLMEAICHVFMNHACNEDLDALMKKVSRRVRRNHTDDGSKQACEFVQRAFDRVFYFNPEPLNTMGLSNMHALSRVLSESTGSLDGTMSPVTLSPTYRRRVKTRYRPRGSTPEPPTIDNYFYQNRRRNLSGASNASERSLDELDPLDLCPQNAALHPRVRSLSATRTHRRISLPDPTSLHHHQPAYLNHNEHFNFSFSEHVQGSRGTTPDPFESPVHNGSGNVFLHISEAELESPVEGSYDSVDNVGLVAGAVGGAAAAALYPGAEGETHGQNPNVYSTSWGKEEPGTEQQGRVICHSQSSTTFKEYEDDEMRESRSFKRQLSVPSNQETLQKINDVRKYLQVHDSDPQLLKPLLRIESFVNKKKYEGKRRKKDDSDSV